MPLKLTKENQSEASPPLSNRKIQRQQCEAKFDRMWLLDPEQFNPERNAREKERLHRVLKLIREFVDVKGKKVVDLGCGYGTLAKYLVEKGAEVDVVDISVNALKRLQDLPHIHPLQDYIPYTKLEDDEYDLVISADLIAYLPETEYRLFFSELTRLTKEGYIVCSTPVDIHSEDALQRFLSYAETELQIEKWVLAHDNLYIIIENFLKAPKRFAEGTHKKNWWFQVNSTWPVSYFWKGVACLLSPLVHLYEQSTTTLRFLSRISAFLWPEERISHITIIAKRKPLYEPPPPEIQQVERKAKKMVWE